MQNEISTQASLNQFSLDTLSQFNRGDGTLYKLWCEHKQAIRFNDKPEGKVLIVFDGMPGAGKSMAAHFMAFMLNVVGVKSEYIREYARDAVIQQKTGALTNSQSYIAAKQWSRITSTMSQFPVGVADADMRNSLLYPTPDTTNFEALQWLARAEHFHTVHIFLEPQHQVTLEGRHQNNTDILYQLGVYKKQMLQMLDIHHTTIPTDTRFQQHLKTAFIKICTMLNQQRIINYNREQLARIDWDAYAGFFESMYSLKSKN